MLFSNLMKYKSELETNVGSQFGAKAAKLLFLHKNKLERFSQKNFLQIAKQTVQLTLSRQSVKKEKKVYCIGICF